jgi:hypothetical protein
VQFVPNNKNSQQKRSIEKDTGKFNPGNMAGKTATHKGEAERFNADSDTRQSRAKDQKAKSRR